MTIALNKTEDWLAQSAQRPHLPGQHLGWLAEMRKIALQRFEQIGLPGIRDEDWRYTNLRALKSNLYCLVEPQDPQPITLPQTSNPRLVFVNGFYSKALSTTDALSSGVTLTSINELLVSDDQLVEKYLGQALPEIRHGFTELNTALFQDGFVLLLDKDTVCTTLVEILFVTTGQNQQQFSHPRNLIVAGSSSQCTIIERHIEINGTQAVYLNNCITEIIAEANAHIDYYKLQHESAEAFHVGGVFVHLHRDAWVATHNLALGGLLARNDINMQLLGVGAHAEMNGLVLGKGHQHVDNHTEVNHAVAHCSSDEYYKSILDDHSRSVFRGRIIVAQDAQKTDAEQQNNNLLLSRNAEADAKPQLEIYADDVKCSHGVTVGQLDPKSIFYMQSRGISTETAQALLTFAFANEVLERIKVDSVKQQLTELLAGQLLADTDFFEPGELA